MAKSTFKYTDQAILSNVYPNFANLIPRNRLHKWRELTTNVYAAERVGFGTALFYGGKDLSPYLLTATAASATTTITEAITEVDDTTIVLDDVSNTDKGTIIQIGSEKMFVVSVATKTATVIRGFFGTTRATALNGATVNLIGLSFDSQYEWHYDSTSDMAIVYSTTDPGELIMEMGHNKDTYVDQALVDASMELNSSLDVRFRGTVPKSFQYSSAPSTDTPEYDYIILRITALLALANMASANNDQSLMAFFRDQVSNDDNSGLLDDLNSGAMTLSSEISKGDKKGKPITIVQVGTMYPVEITGEWVSAQYERVQVLCTTAGVYGTAEISILTSGNNKLFGNVQTGIKVTGQFQKLIGDVKVRFEGNSMTADDRWDFIFQGTELKQESVYSTIRKTRPASRVW
jgi:hypothetical protein